MINLSPYKLRLPKIIKGLKDYECLTCGKEIPKGRTHLTFTYLSPYLRDAFKELTKYHVYIKIFEAFLSLRFCSRRCFNLWYKYRSQNFPPKLCKPILKRLRLLEKEARDRRLKGWKNWKTWQEVFKPLDNRYRVD